MSSAVCSITDSLECIKARVDASLAKMDAADGRTQRARRPQSAQLVSAAHSQRQRPSTACSSNLVAPSRSKSENAAAQRPPVLAAAVSRDLLAYARQRFQDVAAAEDALVNDVNSHFDLSAASHQSHLTSKTLVSAYVTLTSSGRSTPAALPSLRPTQKADNAQRLRMLNEIRVRGETQPVRLRHDRVAQELCQEGELLSRTAVYPYSWPDTFRWHVQPHPQFERERKAAQEQLEKRLAAATDLPEPEKEEKKGSAEQQQQAPPAPAGKGKSRQPRGPPSVSSIGSTEKRKVHSAVRRVEREVSKLKAEVKRRAEEEAAAAAAAAVAEDPGASDAAENQAVAERSDSLPPTGPKDDSRVKTEVNEEEELPSEEVPDFLCPSSEEKSRQHEVRLWLRKTTYSNAPGFLPIY